MIIYTGTVEKFINDVDDSIIANQIEIEMLKRNIRHNNISEFRSWENSLLRMSSVLNHQTISKDLNIAIEYQIPATSKRVDFIITGKDSNNDSNIIIIELKQWEEAERTSREDLVTTYLGGANRTVTHPSYQAYSYAKVIENYNEYVQNAKIVLKPCCYLHNYREDFRDELDNDLYQKIIQEAPMFLKNDSKKLRDFISQYIKCSDNGELLYQIDNGKIKPSKVLQDSISSMLKGNEEFYMIDEQKVVFSTVKKLVENAIKYNEKYTIIVEGGPGTGKSVIAINLLVEFRSMLVNYVTKNAAPRNVYFSKLRDGNYKLNYVKTLFKGSGVYTDSKTNEFDCLIVDEAHRLNEKSGMFENKGENQIKEIINTSKVSVFFIDEDQIVTTKDFGSIKEIEKQAKKLGSKVFKGEDYILTSQFRCNGSDGYISFLDNILEIRDTANYDGYDMDYEIKIFDNPNEMRDKLRILNKINNKARMVAGYCYEWISKTNPKLFDIKLENNFIARWNLNNTQTWAIDEESFEEVGCIHTCQGLEFDYIGVIIGKDLIYRDGKVITDYTARAKTDASLKGIKTNKNFDVADRIIRNTYKTLMSRGQKGCYLYIEDEELRNYLKIIIRKTIK